MHEDDPATLRSANNFAIDLHLPGSYEDARRVDEDTLRRRTVLLGSQNPELLSSVNAVARDLPETLRVEDGQRAECDIEVPPT